MRSQFALWLSLTLAFDAFAQPVDVACGLDLVTWDAIELRDLSDADQVASYQAFVAEYPSSTLAIAAWDRLVELDGSDPWSDDPAVLAAVQRVRSGWEAHQAVLAAGMPEGVEDLEVSLPALDDVVLGDR